VAGCCDPHGWDRIFDERFARRRAARYRSKGLDRTARRMVDHLPADDVRGATVLEIGGGVGEIHLELLRRGAASATNLELSSAYDAEAARLIEEAGLTGRVSRRLTDIATDPAAVEPADIVVLHRVVCCYPDYAKLLGAAADHARRHVVFSHPPRNLVSRSLVATQNALLRWGGRKFQAFTHAPGAMRAVLADRGMRPAVVHRGAAWQVTAATR
jgi:2-polyprenyl-3-methyl-5-hydroxy-6-metoxy-1,4-benzoquinol methylase